MEFLILIKLLMMSEPRIKKINVTFLDSKSSLTGLKTNISHGAPSNLIANTLERVLFLIHSPTSTTMFNAPLDLLNLELSVTLIKLLHALKWDSIIVDPLLVLLTLEIVSLLLLLWFSRLLSLPFKSLFLLQLWEHHLSLV